MLNFEVKHQETYSRGELLLRTFFGFLYIAIPHGICLMVLGLWGAILRFITFWIILFTGKYPKNFFEYQVKLMRWQLRVQARMMNLADGYPAFGLDATDTATTYDVTYREEYSRGQLLLILFFGGIMVIPHIIAFAFCMIGVYFCILISWFVVLFTGKYPKGMHDFVVNTFRWLNRVVLYLQYMYPKYPPFSGKSDQDLGIDNTVLDK